MRRRPLRNFWLNLRRAVRRRLRPHRPAPPAPKSPPGPPRVDFSYTIYWTKQVRQWTPAHRDEVHAALLGVMAQPDFEANAYERRYRVRGLDDQAHSGASLLALRKVLRAFTEAEQPAVSDDE